ncbi:hypothetical protein BKA81DRAFT_375317 [Phyllosticta paracitricarpa]
MTQSASPAALNDLSNPSRAQPKQRLFATPGIGTHHHHHHHHHRHHQIHDTRKDKMADISSQGRGGAMMAEISMMDCLIILGNYSRREELQERKIRRMETDNGEDDDDDDDNDDDDNDDGSCMVVFRVTRLAL